MFSLQFEDGTNFNGQSLPKSQWLKAPEKKINQMTFKLGNKLYLFQGFNSYNHLHENIALAMEGVTKILLMARGKKETFILTIDFIKKEVYHNICEVGHEYGMQELSGWKEGNAVIEPSVVEINMIHEDHKILYPIGLDNEKD